MSTHDPHGWVRARLAAWSAGVLDDQDEARLAAHLAGCAACRTWAEPLTPDADAPAGDHVPDGLLAHWPRAAVELHGLERALVRRHVERCVECRAILARLGHDPAAMRPEPVPSLVPARTRRLPTAWLAAAALVVVAVVATLARRPAPAPVAPAPAPVARAAELRAVREWGADAVELRDPVRGAGEALPEVTLAPDRAVTFTTSQPDVPAGVPIEARLVGPDGATLARARLTPADRGPRPAFVFDPHGTTPAEGRWELVLSANGAEVFRGAFRVTAAR